MPDRRLLILDDDQLTAQTIQNIAEFSGIEVRATQSHDQFFDWVSEWKPGYIVLDLIMPKMDGVQIMAKLGEAGCEARVILTSGVAPRVMKAAEQSARQHGLDLLGALYKPFSPAQFRGLLNREPPLSLSSSRQQAGTRGVEIPVTVQDLKYAIEHEQLLLTYQPKVWCRTGQLAGFEALVRWQHPQLGLIGPDRFIALAETNGLIDSLTEWVIDRALSWFSGFTARHIHSADTSYLLASVNQALLAINISARSLPNFQLFERCLERARFLGIDPSQIVFELTETSAMEDSQLSLDNLTRLRMKGFLLSIDDFGTGYSSMHQLVRLPFSEIKIDKSFVMSCMTSVESRTVVRSIVDLGASLGLTSTAEGIEDQPTLDFLASIGCDIAQGYFIGYPMAANDVDEWFESYIKLGEVRRARALHRLNLLDTEPEVRFDSLTRLAQHLFHSSYAAISLLEHDRQWFKSRQGFTIEETPRTESICTFTIEQDDVLVVEDTLKDSRTSELPLVSSDPKIRFYAGCPLTTDEGYRVGTLCVMDTKPRSFSARERAVLKDLGEQVEVQFGLPALEDTDGLFRVLSRSSFEKRADPVISLGVRLQSTLRLATIRLEGLAGIRQSLGSSQRAIMIKAFAKMLSESFGFSDLIARLEEDVFVTLSLNDDLRSMETALNKLTVMVSEFNSASDRVASVNFSVGQASCLASPDLDLRALIADANAHRVGSIMTG